MLDKRFRTSHEDEILQPAPRGPLLARLAGVFLTLAALCALGAVVAYGSTLKLASPWVIGCIVVGLGALAGWFVGRSQEAHLPRDQWARQRTLLGVNSLSSLLLFLLLLVGVNYMAARRHKTFDLTSNKINSLSEQTHKALDKLPGPVHMTYVFALGFGQRGPNEADSVLLDNYKNASDKVRVEYFNADTDMQRFQKLNLPSFSRGQAVLLIQKDEKGKPSGEHQQVDVLDEQNITSTLMKLGENKAARTLYFLTGHAEFSLGGAGGQVSFNEAKSRLEAQNYTIKPLNLTGLKATIPSDASVILALAPQNDLSPREAKLFKDYLAARGRLLLTLGPQRATLPQWKAVTASMGVEVQDGGVIDPDQTFDNSGQIPLATVSDAMKHPVLSGVGEGRTVVFPLSTPLKAMSAAPPGVTATALLETSPASQAVSLGGGSLPRPGPFALAVASGRGEVPPPQMPGMPPPPPAEAQARAVVVGSTLFATDQFILRYGNANMFLAAVNWVAGNELLVSIPPKQPVTNTITLTGSALRFVVLLALFALPLSVLLLGGVMWWKRR